MTVETSITSQTELEQILPELMPIQGSWSAEQYLSLTDNTNRLIEFTDGYIEVLPMPTDYHQSIVMLLYELLIAFIRPAGGKVLVAPLRLHIAEHRFREPDVLLLRDARDSRRQNRYWLGADLVVEVVSPDKPERDLVQKRGEYAAAQIPEYWIVNPATETITVLRLAEDNYVEHGAFGRGTMATSALMTGFSVAVDTVFDAD